MRLNLFILVGALLLGGPRCAVGLGEECPVEQLDPGEPALRTKIATPMSVTRPKVDAALAEAVNGLASERHLIEIERLLDEVDGLNLQPLAQDVRLGTAQADLKDWQGRVDEFFANAEFNDDRKQRLRTLFLEYVNHPPGGYLPGFERTHRQTHQSVDTFLGSTDGPRELELAERTLSNSFGFAELIDVTKDDNKRLGYAMKVRTSYFLRKLILTVQADPH